MKTLPLPLLVLGILASQAVADIVPTPWCYPTLNGVHQYERSTLMGVGEERAFDGIVHACVDDGIYQIHDEIIGCVSQFGNFIKIGENVTERYRFKRYNSFCIADGDYNAKRVIVEEKKENYDSLMAYPQREVLECAQWVTNEEAYHDKVNDVIVRCRFDHRGRFNNTVLACFTPQGIEITVGQPALVRGVYMQCRPTEAGKAVIEPVPTSTELPLIKCENGRLLNEEWDEGSYIKACQELIEQNIGRLEVIAIGCITYKGDRIEVGSSKRYEDGAVMNCVRVGKTEAAMRFLPAGTIVSFCENGMSLEEEWAKNGEGGNVLACVPDYRVKDSKMHPIIVVKACTYQDVVIPVDEERKVPHGTCKCKRRDGVPDGSDKTKFPVMQAAPTCIGDVEEVTITTADVPENKEATESSETTVECDNGKRLKDTWIEKLLELTCKLDENGKPKVTVAACLKPRRIEFGNIRIPLGEKALDEHGHLYFACIPTEDGSAKLERVTEKCENGKEVGEEWTEHQLLKKCERMQDGGTVMAVKGCFVSANESIAVGESKDLAGYGTCHCDRVDVNRNRDKQAREVNLWCESERPDCKRPENLDVEKGIMTPFGKIVMACKSKTVTALKRNITTVEYKAIRCITPLGDEITAGEQKIKNMILFKCHPLPVLGMLPGVRITMEKLDPRNATCDNGVPVGKQQIEGDVLKVCNQDLVWQAKGCVALTQGVEIYVGQVDYRLDMFYFCEKRGEFDAELVRKTPREICEKGYPALDALDYPRNSIPSWIEGDYVKNCTIIYHDTDMMHVVSSIGCIIKEGDFLEIGKEKENDHEGVRYVCEKDGEFGARLLKMDIAKPQKCENGLAVSESETVNGVELLCTHDLQLIAWVCVIPNKLLAIGETERENATQYSCEKRGEYSAELVVKSFSQLCEEGDTAVEAWISEGVLRDCDRKSEKPTVHARLCVLPDDRIIEVGENITEEFTTYKCERKGEFDALLEIDLSKIHADYFTKSRICMNGKKVGEEWTKSKYIRRACHQRKGRKPVIVDLGCVLPDGRIIDVGKEASWRVDATATADGAIYHLNCKEGKRGFGAKVQISAVDVPQKRRICENKKFEGDTWEDKNVLRTCKEVDDKLLVVALHCVFGNETLDIGELRKASDVSSIECVRVGQNDATVAIDLVPIHDRACVNDRKLNEEWTDEHFVRKACRIRNRKATVVDLGCVLKDGRILAVGEEDVKEENRPGYDRCATTTRCNRIGDYGAFPSTHFQSVKAGSSGEKDCGDKENGEVWVTEKFIKKCKVIDSETSRNGRHSAGTIGCVTLKGTHMLEGEALDEDDYHIVCKRDENDKLEILYSFTVKEQ